MEEESVIKKVIKEWGGVVIATIVISFLILHFIQVARVHGASMEPTYHDGNVLIVDKVFFKKHPLDYGDVVIVNYVDSGNKSTLIIKRVIGVGGDHLEVRNNKLYRNDHLVREDYINSNTQMEDMDIYIDEGQVFVMGDNRNNSLDSRMLGPFDFEENVVGKVVFKLF